MGQDWPIISFLREWWPIFFIVFFETVLGREHSEKVKKKFIGNFYFWGITLRCSLGGENLPKLACLSAFLTLLPLRFAVDWLKKCFYASGLHSRITVTGFNCSHQSEANSPLSRPIRDQNVLTSRVSTWVTDANRGNHFPAFTFSGWLHTHSDWFIGRLTGVVIKTPLYSPQSSILRCFT